MKLHGNARTCPKSRRLLVDRVLVEKWSVTAAAEAAGVSERTVWRWLKRWRDEGRGGLMDRSSRPHRSPKQLARRRVEAIRSLRKLRMTAAHIAEILGLALSTVSLWLKRIGLGKRSWLAPLEPVNRYERRHPGELVHVDIKQLGRISKRGAGHRVVGSRQSQITPRKHDGRRIARTTGFEYVHVMVDDHTRLAYAEVLPTLTARDAVGFLRRAVAWFAERGVVIRSVMSDNGSAYVAHAHRKALAELGLKHLRIRPYRPRTNGKACVSGWPGRPLGRRGSPRPAV
jgi:transposase